MATVLPTPPARATKFDARVDQALGQAVGRIRLNDLLTGGAAVAAVTLCYAVVMIAVDSRLDLPMGVRQVGLGGLVLVLAAVAYVWLVRPLRRTVNPRYAARRLEATAADSKNAVINYVDLKDRQLPESVWAAIGQKAAAGLAGADVNKATESRALVWLGGAVGLLLAALAVLFVLLKPAPFYSLVSRAFNPFVQRAIATRTYLTLTEPAGGDLTVTAGEPVTVAVEVDGRVPDPDGASPLKLLVRYTLSAEDADGYPLVVGETARTWRVTLPPDRVQNGFWYRVVGGDTETPEHRVTVRTRPLFTGFEVAYEAPAYTRIRPATARFPTPDGDRVLKVDGYRGTKVTLLAAANRPVKSGWASLPGEPDLLRGEVVGEAKDAVRFRFDLKQSGRLRLGFVSADDEASAPGAGYAVRVLTDAAPQVTLDAPAEAEVTLPANGRLDLEATISDDFGIDTVTLRLKRTGAPLNFQPVPYRGGKSFRRADGSYPTALTNAGESRTGYKETVQLTSLKDSTGRAYQPQPGDVIEYWLEATDNCTEPKPNVGRSAVRTVKIAPAVTDPPKQEQLRKDGQRRQAEQKQHEAKQDQQLQGERREPKQAPGAQLTPEGQPEKKEEGDPGAGQQGGRPQQTPKGKAKDGEKGSEPGAGSAPSGSSEPNTEEVPQPESKDGAKPPEGAKDKGSGASPKADGSKPAEKKAIDQEADQIRQKLEKAEGKGENQPGQGATSQQQPEQAPQPQPPGTDRSQQGAQPPQPQPGGPGKRSEDEQKEIQKAIDDLGASDPDKRQAARDKLDKAIGEEQRKRAEKLTEDLKSGDPERVQQARKELGELDRETGTGGAGIRDQGRKEEVERLIREGQDLDSPDDKTRQDAERKFDDRLGRDGRERLQKDIRDLKSKDEQRQKKAREDVDELVKKEKKKPKPQTGTQDSEKKDGQPQSGGQPDASQLAEQARDLASDDAARRQAAEKEFDQRLGPEQRKQLQQAANDLKSGDQQKQQTAKEQIDKAAKEMADKGEKSGTDRKLTKEEMDKLAEQAKDLTSPDDAKRKAAEQALDEAVGKPAREQMQKDLNDLKSMDQEVREKARKRVEKTAQEAAEKSGQKGPSKEDIEKLAEQAKDLTSPDDAKRKAAEKRLDDALGKDARERIQKELNDLQSSDPATKKAAQDRLTDALKKLRGGNNPDEPAKPYEDNPLNRLKSAQLQLEKFERAKANKEALKRLGYTEAEFERFLAGYRQRVAELEAEVEQASPVGPDKPPTGPPTVKVGEGSGGKPLAKKDGGPATAGPGPGTAPPGYDAARKKFAEEAAKLRKPATAPEKK
jgi:hypothetical protein